MDYTNKQLENYVGRIKLTQQQKSSYSQQIDNLKKNVVTAVNALGGTRVVKVIIAGSWKKGTALAPKGDLPLDVDMVFYLDVDEDSSFDAEELRDEVIDVLCAAYPTKNRSDFTGGDKTIGVVFRGSGLEVDIVPFIQEKGISTYGRQPRKILNSGDFRTSVEKQLKFAKETKDQIPTFTSIVRILKSWRNYKELDLSSFSIELGVAHLVHTHRLSSTSISKAVISFFELFGSGNPIEVFFPGAIGTRSGGSPWIADPTNNENNTIRLADFEWNEVVEAAEQAFETISYALVIQESGKTLSLWKEIFGPAFNIQERY